MTAAECPLFPIDDRIVAVEIPAEPEADGLWRPPKPGPIRATVVASGPGRFTNWGTLMPPPAQPGDVVLLAEHGPSEVDVDGVSYLCAPPMLVLAVER